MRISDWSSDVCSSDLTRALEYVAVRRLAESPMVPIVPHTCDPRGVARRMMKLLNKAAVTCRPCPTNAELAVALGLKNAEVARDEFNRLVRQGKIALAGFGSLRRRGVTNVATGQQTREGRWGACRPSNNHRRTKDAGG